MQESGPNYYKYQPLLLAVCTLIGMYGGYKMRLPVTEVKNNSETQISNSQNTIQHLKDVFGYLDAHYPDSILYDETSDYLTYQLCLALDPFAEYIPVSKSKKWFDELNPSFNTIGLKSVKIDSKLIIHSILPNSDAAEKGLKAGYEILRINGTPVYQSDDIDSIAENTSGGEVKIDFKDFKNDDEKNLTLQIKSISNPSISLDFNENQQYFYIRLEKISQGTYREFMNKLEDYIQNQKIKNMILDLRGNGGGLLNEAADILNQLVAVRDAELFKTVNKNGRDKSYKSTGKPFFRLEKIVILIDQQTASSAEVIAGSLQDLKLAVLIGQETKGKATVLEPFKLAGGAQILIPTARIYLPSGRCFQKPYETFTGQPTEWLSIFSNAHSEKTFDSTAILPDIHIGKQLSLDEFDEYSELNTILEKIILKQLAFIQKEFLHDDQIISPKLEVFVSQILEKELAYKYSHLEKSKIQNIFQSIILEKTIGQSEAIRASLKTDPVFLKAVETIKKSFEF
ncbi:MAG: PDZ domain-containing protein [Saprospiraceae bacterium]|nr:PDZ domain-containing protein [Saprospiraceae bacterium]MBK7811557.1 PDZ domain-containing protein [Saprospiraceae bacterium]MBK9631732.1 PDZ domain-containing protein [Saprospiraceae bacterium]